MYQFYIVSQNWYEKVKTPGKSQGKSHSLILQILWYLQQKTEPNWTSTLIFLTINIYPQAKSQAPDSVHWHHKIALGMQGLGVNKLKDNNKGYCQKIFERKSKIWRRNKI